MTVIKQQAKGRTYWYSRHVVDGKRTQVRIPDLDPETGRKITTEKQRTSLRWQNSPAVREGRSDNAWAQALWRTMRHMGRDRATYLGQKRNHQSI